MTTRYISFAPLKFLFAVSFERKTVEHTTTRVKDPLQIKLSLQFDKWQIKRAEMIATTVKNTALILNKEVILEIYFSSTHFVSLLS